MAQKLTVLLEDDLDGSTAEETIRFGLDGVLYEIDLSRENALDLRTKLGPYVGAARRPKGPAARPGRARGSAADDARNQEIRSWARENGLKVSDRGRIPAGIVARYEAANGK